LIGKLTPKKLPIRATASAIRAGIRGSRQLIHVPRTMSSPAELPRAARAFSIGFPPRRTAHCTGASIMISPTEAPPPASRATRAGSPAPATARATVLCVDDEPGILAALKRVLRLEGIAVLTAGGGAQALEILHEAPVDLVISDMRMPHMDGAQLLERIHAEWPGITRILLTGHSDPAATVAAVNRGHIFRYLHKPWDEHELVRAVHDGVVRAAQWKEDARLMSRAAAQNAQLRQLGDELQQLQQRVAEDRRNSDAARQRHYLQSVKVLTNLMEVRSGGLFEHGRRVAALARDLARAMGLPGEEVLDVFVAGLLHDIGLIGLSEEHLSRLDGSGASAEAATYRDHAALSARALAAMEDMLPVARLIEAHHERFDGAGFPAGAAGDAIPLGARILALADAVDDLEHGRSGEPRCAGDALLERLRTDDGGRFDPAVVQACLALLARPRAS
jgi:putative nucleotidyltransferase with HDIG domain